MNNAMRDALNKAKAEKNWVVAKKAERNRPEARDDEKGVPDTMGKGKAAKRRPDASSVDFSAAMGGVIPLAPQGTVLLAPTKKNSISATPNGVSEAPKDGAQQWRVQAGSPGPATLPVRMPAGPPIYRHLREPTPQQPKVQDAVTLRFGPHPDLLWRPVSEAGAALLDVQVAAGRKSQIHSGRASAREVVMGLDFGTSSTKVVISDKGLNQSFAVPFRDAVGVDSYLLPSRLYESPLGYSLLPSVQETRLHSDLKLGWLASLHDAEVRGRITAFLALVIQRARAWLFEAKRELYQHADIVWTLTLGQPANHAADPLMKAAYRAVGQAAWQLAGAENAITPRGCVNALQMAQHPGSDDVEILPMPEIAAQIHGFVSSNQFDPKGRNIFLLTDVGAGTVDSSLFRVFRTAQGQWSLEVYTSAVKMNGVMNLHRHRVAWWQTKISESGSWPVLVASLGEIGVATEHQTTIPERFDQYLQDVTPELTGRAMTPDQEFFERQLLAQVQGRTLHHAFTSGVLAPEQVTGAPFFLCGGGARLDFYRRLGKELARAKGYGWLSAHSREFTLPRELEADGLLRQDFDRLSVAYGLSRLDFGNAERALPLPRVPATSEADATWERSFVSKDQC